MKLLWSPKVVEPGKPTILSSVTYAEIELLQELAKGKRVLEIGSALGYSTICMAKVASHVTSIDHHLHLPDGEATFRSNLRVHGVEDKVTVLVGSSREIFQRVVLGDFDLAFIDGDHTATGVTFDADRCLFHLVDGGFFAFHDYGEEQCPEVKPAVDAFFGLITPKKVVDTLCVIKRVP